MAPSSYIQLSRYPSVTQDITLKTAQNLSFGDLEAELNNQLNQHMPEHSSYEVNPTSIYQAKLTDNTKNITYRIKISNFERTLTDKEINKLLDKVSSNLDQKLDAKRI